MSLGQEIYKKFHPHITCVCNHRVLHNSTSWIVRQGVSGCYVIENSKGLLLFVCDDENIANSVKEYAVTLELLLI